MYFDGKSMIDRSLVYRFKIDANKKPINGDFLTTIIFGEHEIMDMFYDMFSDTNLSDLVKAVKKSD